MRFPWQRREEYEFIEEDKPKKRETLSQVAEKILIRKMKKDPDNYGLRASEKLKGIAKDENQSLANQLKSFKEIRLLFREVMGGSDEGKTSFLQDLIRAAPELMASIAPLIAGMRGGQGQYIERGTTVPRIEAPKATSPQPLVTQPEAPPPAKLGELLVYLEHSPEKAVEALKEQLEANNIQAFVWISLLKVKSFDEIVALLKPFEADATYGEAVHKLLNKNGGKWLKRFVELAKLIEY